MKRSDITQFLPGIVQQTLPTENDNLLTLMLGVMEVMDAPSDDILGVLDQYFDPLRAPKRFVPYLASWLALDALWLDRVDTNSLVADYPEYPPGWHQLRHLMTRVVQISRLRGTAEGMQLFLETATGVTGFRISDKVFDQGAYKPFHIRVTVPVGGERFASLVKRIVEMEKPAYVTYEIRYANQQADDEEEQQG